MEILTQKTNAIIASNIIEFILTLKNVEKVEIYYKWELIKKDLDDNKFIDCSIASNADFIITNDKHFNELNSIDFPKVKILNSEEFLQILKLI